MNWNVLRKHEGVIEVVRGLLGVISKDIFTLEDRRRYARIAITLAFPITVVFSLANHFKYGYPTLGTVEALVAVFLLIPAMYLSKFDRLVSLAESLILVYGIAITVALGVFGGLQGTGILWVFTFPFLAFWLKGQRKGLIWNGVWIVVMAVMLNSAKQFSFGYNYDIQYVEQVVSALVFYTLIALAFNYSRTRFEERLVDRAHANTAKANEYLERLKMMAYHDMVTGLPNRARLSEMLGKEIERIKDLGQTNQPLLVVNIRLKRMFEISNLLGVEASDRLVRSIAETMVNTVGEQGFFGRTRRDEFVCVYRAENEAMDMKEIIRRITGFRLEYKIDDYPIHIEHTIGIANFPLHSEEADPLLKKAEQAMLQAQFAKKELAFYDERQEQQFVRRHLLFAQLHQALNDNVLSLHYQGQIDLKTGKVIGAEALARWFDPVKGPISPAEFIPIAEKSGLIKPFTLWVLREAFGQIARWKAEGLSICVSVNISARSVVDPDFVPDVQRLVEEYQLPPQDIILELTESSFVDSPQTAMETIQRLHALGFKQSIDDFGTGYSSLSYLKNLQVDELKVDQSFVRTLGKPNGSDAIVQSTIQLAHNLDLKVVAEGIETDDNRRQLIEMGCDIGQGYFFCKPMAADAFFTWANTWNAKLENDAQSDAIATTST